MLYVIHRANHEQLTYRGGQDSIVHLECALHPAVQWAEQNERRWAFTALNASAVYCEFYSDMEDLSALNWQAIGARRWAGEGIPGEFKDGKQAEFLVEECFPWELVERVGTYSSSIAGQAARHIQKSPHQPTVETERGWYY